MSRLRDTAAGVRDAARVRDIARVQVRVRGRIRVGARVNIGLVRVKGKRDMGHSHS